MYWNVLVQQLANQLATPFFVHPGVYKFPYTTILAVGEDHLRRRCQGSTLRQWAWALRCPSRPLRCQQGARDRSGLVDAYGVHVKVTFPVDLGNKHGQKQVDWIRVNRGPQASDCISIY